MTIVGNPDAVVGGVDTHADVHVAAVVNHLGGVLGVESFTTTSHGYRQLVSWLRSHGELVMVGVEGTGSYGCRVADTEKGPMDVTTRPGTELHGFDTRVRGR